MAALEVVVDVAFVVGVVVTVASVDGTVVDMVEDVEEDDFVLGFL